MAQANGLKGIALKKIPDQNNSPDMSIDKSLNVNQEPITPNAQSVLLSYIQKNPHNHKVISFLKKQ